MRIAVTGGNGRIGQAVIALALTQGHSVVNIDRIPNVPEKSGVTYCQLDTTDYGSFEQALHECDALIHLAAITSVGKHPDYIVHNNNVVSSYNALRAAAQQGIKHVCQASSINAIGGVFSRWPRYDYFPLDEQHPTYNEDPYSLSKWICECQADSMVRQYADMKIASLRIHGIASKPADTDRWRSRKFSEMAVKHLWGFTHLDAAARACLLGITADFSGHEVFYIVSPKTMMEEPSLVLKERHYPDVPIWEDISGHKGFFNCQKAMNLLGWQHSIV